MHLLCTVLSMLHVLTLDLYSNPEVSINIGPILQEGKGNKGLANLPKHHRANSWQKQVPESILLTYF